MTPRGLRRRTPARTPRPPRSSIQGTPGSRRKEAPDVSGDEFPRLLVDPCSCFAGPGGASFLPLSGSFVDYRDSSRTKKGDELSRGRCRLFCTCKTKGEDKPNTTADLDQTLLDPLLRRRPLKTEPHGHTKTTRRGPSASKERPRKEGQTQRLGRTGPVGFPSVPAKKTITLTSNGSKV